MQSGRAFWLLTLAAGSLAASALAAEALDPAQAEGIIFERQEIMSKLGRDSDTLGDIVAGLQPADKLPEVTRAIATGARESLEAYRTPVPGGRTKPEAWTNSADFTARMEAFMRNAEAMAVAGEKRDIAGVTGLMVDAMPCKQCHDVYRAPKKP